MRQLFRRAQVAIDLDEDGDLSAVFRHRRFNDRQEREPDWLGPRKLVTDTCLAAPQFYRHGYSVNR